MAKNGAGYDPDIEDVPRDLENLNEELHDEGLEEEDELDEEELIED